MTRDMTRAAAQAAQVALFGTILSAVQPANVGQRFSYDDAYGHFNAHPADPRTDDDEALSADDARDMATDHVLSYAESVADWLAKACDTPAGRAALDVSALSAGQVIEGTPATLLAVLMTGDNTQALRALHRLRELAGRAFAAEVAERAKLEVAL